MIYLLFIAIFIGACLLLYMWKEAFADRIIYKDVYFADFPESLGEVKIFFISDIHKRKVSGTLIHEVKEKKADMVIIGGDLMEKGVPFNRVKENLLLLKEIAPVYFVWGNNDYEVDYHQLDTLLLDSGVKILDNTAVSFESDQGDRFILMGIDDMNQKRDNLELALEDAGEDGFKVLVSHNPMITKKIKKDHHIRFVLSGHTHGGQIHIFGYSPYEKGKLQVLEETTLLISNGYGTTGLPLRLGAKSETHLIVLKRDQTK